MKRDPIVLILHFGLIIFIAGILLIHHGKVYTAPPPKAPGPTCHLVKFNDVVNEYITYVYNPCPFTPDLGVM